MPVDNVCIENFAFAGEPFPFVPLSDRDDAEGLSQLFILRIVVQRLRHGRFPDIFKCVDELCSPCFKFCRKIVFNNLIFLRILGKLVRAEIGFDILLRHHKFRFRFHRCFGNEYPALFRGCGHLLRRDPCSVAPPRIPIETGCVDLIVMLALLHEFRPLVPHVYHHVPVLNEFHFYVRVEHYSPEISSFHGFRDLDGADCVCRANGHGVEVRRGRFAKRNLISWLYRRSQLKPDDGPEYLSSSIEVDVDYYVGYVLPARILQRGRKETVLVDAATLDDDRTGMNIEWLGAALFCTCHFLAFVRQADPQVLIRDRKGGEKDVLALRHLRGQVYNVVSLLGKFGRVDELDSVFQRGVAGDVGHAYRGHVDAAEVGIFRIFSRVFKLPYRERTGTLVPGFSCAILSFYIEGIFARRFRFIKFHISIWCGAVGNRHRISYEPPVVARNPACISLVGPFVNRGRPRESDRFITLSRGGLGPRRRSRVFNSNPDETRRHSFCGADADPKEIFTCGQMGRVPTCLPNRTFLPVLFDLSHCFRTGPP